MNTIVPVILAGGTGSRLWPVSRAQHPKPFIQLANGQSLLEKVYNRACHFAQAPEIITITNKEYYFKCKAEYEKNLSNNNIFLLEPARRNTAPAIIFSALKVLATYGADAILLILPADHLVENISSFAAHCEQAFAIAEANKLVSFGIKPIFPETGYGYIECGPVYSSSNCHIVSRFIEKPKLQEAETYLQSQSYLWNSGMFCFKARILLQEFARHAPELLAAIKKCWDISQTNITNPSIIELEEQSFNLIQDISIDYALMEKSKEIVAIACDFDWRDIGSWEAFKQLLPADQDGNTIVGNAISIDAKNNFIYSENKIVASIGVDNLTIVDTPDALLVAHRNHSQDVKQVVQILQSQAHKSYLTHRTVIRPWGSYTVLEEGPAFKIKRIIVKPHAALSLQSHQHRSEHWVVVEGSAKVINGPEEYLLKTNESTFVPMQTPHRLSNPNDTVLVIIEVQTGSYLEEDDIRRYEDTYGRDSN